MARFVLTSREFCLFLPPSRGSPALSQTLFVHLLPAAGEVGLAPASQKLNEHPWVLARQLGTRTWEFGFFQNLLHHDILFLHLFWGYTEVTFVYNWIFYTEVS